VPAEVFAAEHPVILSVNLHSRVYKYPVHSVHPSFDIPAETISDWLKVARVHNSRLAEIFFFLKEWAT